MKNATRRRKHVALVLGLGLVTAVLLPSAASGLTVDDGPVPQEILDDYAQCPKAAEFPADFNATHCFVVTARDAEFKLGGTTAKIDGEITKAIIGVGIRNMTETFIIMGGEPGGASEPVFVSGGILGVPELDPILEIDFETLKLLSLGAAPALGEASADRPDTELNESLGFAFWASGIDQAGAFLNMPLSIDLSNTLLGECSIPEFQVNLTPDTAVVPEGVEPMVGSQGAFHQTYWATDLTDLSTIHSLSVGRRGAVFVDNGFAVPGVEGCGIADLGDTLAPLTGGNLVDTVVNGQAGLPSPAGNNHISITIDVELGQYDDDDEWGLVPSV